MLVKLNKNVNWNINLENSQFFIFAILGTPADKTYFFVIAFKIATE
jgi:hypothetical protein